MKVTRKSSGNRIVKSTENGAAKLIDRAMAAGGEVMGRLVAYDTGLLESNNVAESDGNGHGKIVNETPYAFFVEFGTVKMDAQPWFRPARDTIIRTIKRGMRITR